MQLAFWYCSTQDNDTKSPHAPGKEASTNLNTLKFYRLTASHRIGHVITKIAMPMSCWETIPYSCYTSLTHFGWKSCRLLGKNTINLSE